MVARWRGNASNTMVAAIVIITSRVSVTFKIPLNGDFGGGVIARDSAAVSVAWMGSSSKTSKSNGGCGVANGSNVRGIVLFSNANTSWSIPADRAWVSKSLASRVLGNWIRQRISR